MPGWRYSPLIGHITGLCVYPPESVGSPLLIAIIDDEPSIIEYIRLFLEGEGYAVAAWRTEPDALILDMHLEARDAGIRILEGLRADPRTRALPLVVSSAQEGRLRDLHH